MKPALLLFLSTLLHAAVLKPVPSPQIPAGFEANRGQARQDMLFLSRTEGLAITAQGVFYSPYNLKLVFGGGNATPELRPSATLPGVAHVYTGADPRKWVTGIPQYAAIDVPEVWPRIDAQYVAAASGSLLRLICRPGCNLGQVRFELPGVDQVYMGVENSLMVRLQPMKTGPYAIYAAPRAYQETSSGRMGTAAAYEILGADQFLPPMASPSAFLNMTAPCRSTSR